MRGRTAPEGESAALLRYHAYQQKLQLRKSKLSARAITALPHVVSSGWISLGPAPLASDATGDGSQDYGAVSGRATAIAVDPADATGNTVYVGGAYGGVWKSSNAASPDVASVTWQPVLDYAETLAVGAIAIQPGNTDPTKSLILVGTGEPNSSADSYYGLGILRSTDGGQTWEPIIKYANGGSRSFAGIGLSEIAFNSTPGRTNVVVAATGAAATGIAMGLDPTGNNRGLYYSVDSGATWSYATVHDVGAPISPASATSVVYNQATGTFFAALRYHGIYSSVDGVTWNRVANQPAGLVASVCPATTSNACPIYRAEMTVVPGRNEMYTWVVSFDSAGNEVDQGIWLTSNGGGSWKLIADPGITNCGDGVDSGCGVQQGSYNLELAAVPNGTTATDLYAGAVNIYKCTVANPMAASPSCTFLNLTHAYGCSPASALAHVHPDQHALAFALAGNPTQSLMYFANDGGVYRALDGYTGLTTGSCSGHNLFDNLNGTLGSMTQFVSFSMHPTDANTLLGGTQDNGSPATVSATTSTGWGNVLGGDGGYNAISPVNGTDWFAANPDVPPNSLNIQYCNAGLSCNDKRFTQVVTSADVGSDDGSFYFPYILDPKSPTQLVIGTCRVWRGGPATSATGTYTALSNNFDSGAATACTGRETNLVRSLAAGGPSDAAGSQFIYAGTEGAGRPTNPAGGRVFVTQDAGTALMTDVTGDINPKQYPISAIALDPADPSGRTAFVTVMGFGAEVGHIFKTTDAGTSWTNFSGSTDPLPDAPANSVVVDSDTVFVGTDVGVFASDTSHPAWTEVGPKPAPTAYGFLPNVPVTALRIFNHGGKKLLRASTYGRGIWEYDLIATPDYHITVLPSTWTLFPTQTKLFDGTLRALNGYSSQVTLSCTGTTPQTCAPNPTVVTWTTPPVATFKITATGPVGDYPFNIHAIGSDPSAVTHDAAVTLRVVDFAISALTPAAVPVPQGATSTAVNFQLTALGSFSGTIALACSAGLPAGTACHFSPAAASSFPASIQLTITAQASAPVGPASVVISATTPGAPGPRSRTLTLSVTPPVPDYALAISNTPLSANVNQPGVFNGTLKALNGYNTTVNLSCGTGAPPTCTAAPASLVPTIAGVPFTVTVQSNQVQTYNFNIAGIGTDAGHTAHSTPVAFSSAFTFTLSDSTSPQSVKAGQSASFSLVVTPGSGAFPSAVAFACTSTSLPTGAACSFSPAQINGGASGPQTVTLTITTAGPNHAIVRPSAQKNIAPLFWVASVGILSVGFVRKTSAQKKSISLLLQCLLIPSLMGLLSCGGGISNPGTGGGGGSISVGISPQTSSLFPTQQQQFTASVTGSTNTQVSWQVNGATGGTPAGGTIDPNGLYTAPTIVPNPPTVTVSAISQADVTKSASAAVAIQSSTPSGTFTVSITAAVGTSTQTTTAILTVQ